MSERVEKVRTEASDFLAITIAVNAQILETIGVELVALTKETLTNGTFEQVMYFSDGLVVPMPYFTWPQDKSPEAKVRMAAREACRAYCRALDE